MFYTNPNATRPTLVEIHTADLHFGAMDPKIQYDLLTKGILDKLHDIQFDLFCINGDLFRGTFKRTNEGDYHCTPREVKAMLRHYSRDVYHRVCIIC